MEAAASAAYSRVFYQDGGRGGRADVIVYRCIQYVGNSPSFLTIWSTLQFGERGGCSGSPSHIFLQFLSGIRAGSWWWDATGCALEADRLQGECNLLTLSFLPCPRLLHLAFGLFLPSI